MACIETGIGARGQAANRPCEKMPAPTAKKVPAPTAKKTPAPPRPRADTTTVSPAARARQAEVASLNAKIAAAKTPAEAVDAFDTAHEKGYRATAISAIKKALDLCDNQRDALKIASSVDFLGYREVADYADKRIGELESNIDLQ
ncbi:MAG: hypothetical protein FJZ00_08415 [Candidatus Sericytochromatia bacterium]|uniref:Uncharacterized protein n=1 Tax=Candidatus Tanganyikabacteria bacterium TaxID=2961651 RepID=A0A938BNG1_9BACT|nr:hypothetical protein [Candidatus Tanganyikabacteria bacterium]